MLAFRPSRLILALSLFTGLASAGSIVSVTFSGTLTSGSTAKDFFPIAGGSTPTESTNLIPGAPVTGHFTVDLDKAPASMVTPIPDYLPTFTGNREVFDLADPEWIRGDLDIGGANPLHINLFRDPVRPRLPGAVTIVQPPFPYPNQQTISTDRYELVGSGPCCDYYTLNTIGNDWWGLPSAGFPGAFDYYHYYYYSLNLFLVQTLDLFITQRTGMPTDFLWERQSGNPALFQFGQASAYLFQSEYDITVGYTSINQQVAFDLDRVEGHLVVPEPSSWLLLAAGLAFLARRKR